MMELQNARINTAGAFIRMDGCYLFAIGIHLHNGCIPIVRVGGHREGNETGWGCAAREVYEETGLIVAPCNPGITYLADGDHLEEQMQQIRWRDPAEGECDPYLVVAYRRENETLLSLMYLVEAAGLPAPSCEVKGLLLLSREEILRLCRAPLTLEQYLHQGGKAILKAEFDTKLLLEPFVQLRLLSRILSMNLQAQQLY